MKIIKKIRNIFIMTGLFIISVCSKARAALAPVDEGFVPATYAPDRPPSKLSILYEIFKLLIIPIAIIIGLITYYKKSKNNKYKKLIKILVGIIIVIMVGLIIYYINKVY